MVSSWWEEVKAKVASWELLFSEEVKSYFLISAIQLCVGLGSPKQRFIR